MARINPQLDLKLAAVGFRAVQAPKTIFENTPGARWRSSWEMPLSHDLRPTVMVPISHFVAGCHSKPRNAKPSIEFTKAPAAERGGPDRVDTIEGRRAAGRVVCKGW